MAKKNRNNYKREIKRLQKERKKIERIQEKYQKKQSMKRQIALEKKKIREIKYGRYIRGSKKLATIMGKGAKAVHKGILEAAKRQAEYEKRTRKRRKKPMTIWDL